MKSAKKKKSTSAKPVQKQKVPGFPWGLTAVVAALVTVVVICGILAAGQTGPGEEPGTENPGITSPSVDTSNLVTMRVMTSTNAYLTPDKNSSTIYSLRRGDQVEVVSGENGWATIAVEGRGYYVPSDTLRALDEYLIVLDAGHQAREDHGKEAIGPGGADTETRMDVGHVGTATGQQEYELNLAVTLKLKDILEQRGYKVVLIRNHNAVNVSYVERAEVANKLYADAYISLHANSAEDSATKGMMTICQTSENSYNSDIYEQCKELSTLVLDAAVEATGANKQDVKETDEMSGLNWCQVPVTYVEMGYLSNADEDRLMSTDAYRQKIAEGIANGIDKFFEEDAE